MRSLFLAAAMTVMALGLSLPAQAAGGGGSVESTPAKPVDANFARAKAMIEANDYKGALPLLQQVVAKDPKNADAYNLMGYATRKSGDPNASLQYYQQALAIDARHIGAHEYLGEAYLMLGRLPEAEQQLARLDSLCTFGCAEYRQLKTAVADYKAGKRPATN
jgi:tetratricopeptide (TPR) repeat protein